MPFSHILIKNFSSMMSKAGAIRVFTASQHPHRTAGRLEGDGFGNSNYFFSLFLMKAFKASVLYPLGLRLQLKLTSIT